MGAQVGRLPARRVLPPVGVGGWRPGPHDAVHGAFMAMPLYTGIRQGEVHVLGLGVRNGSHRVRSGPMSDTRKSSERPCEATSAEVTIRCASRRFIKSLSTLHLNFRKSTYARRVRQPGEPVVQLYGKNRNNCILLSCSIVLRRAFRCGRAFTFVETKNVPETFTKKGKTYGTTHGWKNGRTESRSFTCTFVTYCPHITFDGWACCSVRCDHLLRWNKLGYPVPHVDWT